MAIFYFFSQMVWLLENKSCGVTVKNYRRLDPNGALYKALIRSDLTQLNLKKPKFLFGQSILFISFKSWILHQKLHSVHLLSFLHTALFSLLEDPECLNLWLKDREIACILNHIILMHNTESSGGRRIN